MQTAAIALVCLLTAGTVAWAAETARPAGELVHPLVEPKTLPVLDSVSKVPGPATLPSRDSVTKLRAADSLIRPRPDALHRVDQTHVRVCFNAADTREKIATHRLTDPIRALRAGRLQGEALRARLCRWKTDEFVYEISVLRRDGRIVHVYMNAENGQSAGALSDADRK